MNLPKAERRVPEYNLNHVRLWFYGLPFSGKTTLADAFPMPLMLNTDGNAKNATSQVITIADEVTVEGRQTKRKFAWDVFKEAITELEKGGNGFETVVVDLIEDVYESCRLYMYDKLKISHEGDDPYKAWDKIRTEYLSNIRRLMVLPYNIILISHEDDSKDITKKTGDKVTAIKPNIAEKVALKLAGMVDVVIRVVADDGVYKLTFKADDVVFGGGRINLSGVTEIPNDYETLINVVKANKATQTKAKPVREEIKPVPTKEEVEKEDQPAEEEKPKRQRRVRKEEPAPVEETKKEEPAPVEETKKEEPDSIEEPKKEEPDSIEEEVKVDPVEERRRRRREAAAIEASQFEQEENKAEEEEPKTEESAPVRRRRKVRP